MSPHQSRRGVHWLYCTHTCTYVHKKSDYQTSLIKTSSQAEQSTKVRWPRGALDSISDLGRDFRLRTSDAILLWPRGALDSISDLRRNFRLRTRFSDFGLQTRLSDFGLLTRFSDFRLRTRFSDFGLLTRFLDFGRRTRFSDFGRDFLTSDLIFFIPTTRGIFPISGRGSVQLPGESIHEH